MFVTTDMKRAGLFALVSLALLSQVFAVLRPLFPVKPPPPFGNQVIVIGDDLAPGSCKSNHPSTEVRNVQVVTVCYPHLVVFE